MQKKDLEYYLALDYDVIVVRIEDEGEHEYKAYAKELGEFAIYGTGASREEAIAHFEEVRKDMFRYYNDNDVPITEPIRGEEIKYSGKFVVRTTPTIHKTLVELADRDGISLNQQLNNILHTYCTVDSVLNMADRKLDRMIEKCSGEFPNIYYIKPTDKSMEEKLKVTLSNNMQAVG